MGRRLLRVLRVALCTAGVLASPVDAGAATITVHDAAGFRRAVATLAGSGGRIVLAPGVYWRPLVVPPRSGPELIIRGTRGAVVEALTLDRSEDVTVTRLRIQPHGPHWRAAALVASSAHRLLLDRLTVTAKATPRRAQVSLDHSSRVLLEGGDFSHCGDHTRHWSFCLLPRFASDVVVEHAKFHDCRGCDFVHGRFGHDLTIRDSSFQRALACPQRWTKCRHQDLIELFVGDGLRLARDRFGVSQRGGAQVYLTNSVDHATIVDNLFRGSDRRAPGVHPFVGLLLGHRTAQRVPRYAAVVNNTFLSGVPTPFGRSVVDAPGGIASSIYLSLHYDAVPGARRPVLANNAIALFGNERLMCRRLSVSASNAVAVGGGCNRSDAVGPLHVDRHGRPTAASKLLIDRGSRRYAPHLDILGRRRDRRPDVGAFEYER